MSDASSRKARLLQGNGDTGGDKGFTKHDGHLNNTWERSPGEGDGLFRRAAVRPLVCLKEEQLKEALKVPLSFFKKYRYAAACLLLLSVPFAIMAYAWYSSPLRWFYHGINKATLLAVRDSAGLYYVSARDNPLYSELMKGTFYHYERQERTTVKLIAEPATLGPDESLKLSWEGQVTDFDVLLFQCEDNVSDTDDDDDEQEPLSQIRDPADILEAATIAQARSTSVHNGAPLTVARDTWLFPRFPVLRYDTCRFLLYEKQGTKFYLKATSNLITLDSHKVTPTGIHLAYTNDPTEMNVSFTTAVIDNSQPIVMYYDYSTNDDDSNQEDGIYYVYGGTTTTYSASDLCQPPANRKGPGRFMDPGALHSLTMTNLEPGAVYSYAVGLQVFGSDDEDDNASTNIEWSDTFVFTAALEPGDDETPFAYLVYGDQGCPKTGCWEEGRDWMETAVVPAAAPVTSLHHFGDLSYARGVAHQWDRWLDMMMPVAARLPLQIAVGNHEYDYTYIDKDSLYEDPSGDGAAGSSFSPEWGNMHDDSRGECGVPMAARFTMPASDNSNGVFWYSHEFGPVHTTVLSSEHNLTAGSVQYDFLEQDLAATDRSITPWVVVELHRPLYEAEKYWSDYMVAKAMREEFEDLLYAYQVDLVLAGHYHTYLRTCDGLYQGHCGVTGAPMYITVGTAGADLDRASLYSNSWTESFIAEYGFGRITVQNASALHFEFVRAGGKDEKGSGETLDDVWLRRARS